MKNKIGIVGGGQLGRMLAFEAKKLGFHVTVIDPTKGSPAAQVVDEHILGGYSDKEATRKLAQQVDYITIEIEHINTETLQELARKGKIIHPSPQTVEMIKDKYLQKIFLKSHSIATADFIEVTSERDIIKAARKYGYPFLLKAKKDAFDGRGNRIIKNQKEISSVLADFQGRELYVEKYVPFKKELAVIAARNIRGEIALYPVVETVHFNNICHIVVAPAPVSESVKKKAEKLAKKTLKYLKGAGVFAVEMFLKKNGEVLVNEIAPRVHNSGHFTIEACVTSQFEQHVRAIAGLPLGKTDMVMPAAVMVNILGERKGDSDISGLDKALKLPQVYVHIYGKSETKPERKMGHITALADTIEVAMKKALKARKHINI